MKRRLKSVRDLKNSGVVTFDYIKTDENLADPFTKGLAQKSIQELSKGMGLRPAN